MPRLAIYKASNADIAVILRKGQNDSWQLIKWNMLDNTFTEGQWLLRKQVSLEGCAISPNGKYFAWCYNRYHLLNRTDAIQAHFGISLIPNFTAIYYSGNSCGRGYVRFDKDNNVINSVDFEPTNNYNSELDIKLVGAYTQPANNGLLNKEKKDFVYNNKLVTVDGYKILMDGKEIYDATENYFVCL
jgi:hypothetical protein